MMSSNEETAHTRHTLNRRWVMEAKKPYKSIAEINKELDEQLKIQLAETAKEARKRAATANIFTDYYNVTYHGLPVDWS